MKFIVLVPDGAADRPLEELEGKTPLEAAYTPNMDTVAKKGTCGMAQTLFPELPFDSSVANMSVLGYDPRKYFSGRAPIEAANLGIELGRGDIAVRCNLITVEDGRIRDFTAGHIKKAEGAKLIEALNEKLGADGIEFYPGTSYRNILVIRSKLKPSLEFLAQQPHDIVGEKVSEYRIKAKTEVGSETAKLLNMLMDEAAGILGDHDVNKKRIKENKNPADSIWLWGAGVSPNMPTFKKAYGIDGSLVSAVDLLKGIGKIVGMRVLEVKGATGYFDTNYEGKADAAVESLREVDLAYVHIESTDEASHEGDVEGKIKAIEDVDERVLGRMMESLEDDYAILVMPDHATPIKVRTHTDEPVPYAIYDTRKKGDSVKSFSEKDIREKGSQPLIEAHKLMGKLTRD
ncbi:MAG: cofactor-independent phosphoglycerate mutase [Candidatus Altiarchaeota archaeon]